MFTLHPEVTGGVFLLNIHRNLHGCGTWHVPSHGKDIEEGVCRPYRTCAIHVPFLPARSNWLARRGGLQLLSSFLYYFPLSYLDQPSAGAEVGRFECFVFLFLALVCRAFCFCFGGH